jgi:hypothetical protein
MYTVFISVALTAAFVDDIDQYQHAYFNERHPYVNL